MSDLQLQTNNKLTKKGLQKSIREKLSAALDEYKKDLGEKKFKVRIKTASKLFSRGIIKSAKKNSQKNQKTTVKKVPAIALV